MIDFTKGTWKHGPRKAELIDGEGVVVRTIAQRKPKTRFLAMGIGDTFARRFPDLFKGCECKKDIVPVMNRWSVERTDAERIQTVATTIANKNKGVTVDDVRGLIQTHLQELVNAAKQ